MIALSLIGVSITRSHPKRSSNPSLVLNAPPYTPTSSPITTTAGSRSISSNMACLMASRKVTGPPFAFAALAALDPLVSATLPPGLSRTGRDARELGRFLFHDGLGRRLGRQLFFDLRFFHGRRGVAKMDRRHTAARAFAGAESFDGPHRRDAGFWRHHFALVAFPLGLNFVAVIAGTIDALGGELRGRHRGILREVAIFLQ